MRIISDSTPVDGGYTLPAEFMPHSGCIMIFPERADSWPYGAVRARKAFCDIAHAISRYENVTMLASRAQYDNARRMLDPRVRVVEMSSDDSWARDVSPEFVMNESGDIRGVDFGFNAWGELYFPWDGDRAIARKLCDLMYYDVYDARDMILEGGAITCDGRGTLITTESCLLNPNRGAPDKEKAEKRLKQMLGVKKVIWLPSGLENDETDGHVDNICQFCAPDKVVLAWCDDSTRADYDICRAAYDVLSREKTADGHGIEIIKLTLPDPIYMSAEDVDGLDYCDGEPTRSADIPLCASYVNFYPANGAVILPVFGGENAENDETAKKIIAEAFPDRKVIPINTRDILVGGGNIHCITHHTPTVYS